MKILQVTQKGIAIGGIESDEHRYNRRTLLIFFVFGLCITSQFTFIVRSANNFIEYTDCVYKTGTTISIAVCYTSLVCQKTKLFSFINDIEKIANKRLQDPKSKVMYEKANKSIEVWSKIVYFVSVILSPISFVLPNIILSFYTYSTTDSGNDAFVLLIPMWLPFNWNNPTGYLLAVTIQYLMVTYVFFFIACSSTIAIAAYLFTITATNDIIDNLQSINEDAKSNKTRSNVISTQLREFIEYHSTLKQSIGDIFKVFQPKCLILLSWSIVLLCGTMLTIKISVQEENNFLLLQTIFEAGYALFVCFLTCELGQRAANAFIRIYDVIDEFEWYLFPIETQQILPTILVATQKLVAQECFGSILCIRGTFKNVVERAYSFFMVLRQFSD